MQLGFNLWAWTWCNISRPRKSGTLGGGTGGTCGARCPGTFAFLEPKEFLEFVEPVKRTGFHRFQAFPGFKHAMVPQVPRRFHTGSLGSSRPLVPQVPDRRLGFNHAMVPQLPDRFLGFNVQHATGSTGSRQVPWVQPRDGSTVELWELWRVWISAIVQTTFCLMHHCAAPFLEWAGMRFWQECLSRI